MKKIKINKFKHRIYYLNTSDNAIKDYDEIYKIREELVSIDSVQKKTERRVYKVITSSDTYYLKIYKCNKKKIIDKFRDSQGVRAFKKGLSLEKKNLNVAVSLAAVDKNKKFSIFVSKEVKGKEIGKILKYEKNMKKRKKILNDFSKEFAKLLNLNYYHGDCHFDNFIYNSGKIFFLDVDAIKKCFVFSRNLIMKNLIRLRRAINVDYLEESEKDNVIKNILKYISIDNKESAFRIIKNHV